MQARWRFTDRSYGDMAIRSAGDLDRRRRSIVDAPWTWLEQVHGATVALVCRAGEHAGARADAAVTDQPGAPLSVQVADCAPVVLVGSSAAGAAAVGVAHAGWRGLGDGVVEATVEALRRLGATGVAAHIGPHIRSRCYEFGAADLDRVAHDVDPAVRSRTAWGAPALDLTAGLDHVLAAARVTAIDDPGTCTACSPAHYSHRARADHGRQAAVVWLEPG